MQLDVSKIKQSNQIAKQLNDERNRLLGEKASAEKNYNRGVASYEQKYGVKLSTDADLQAEYNRIKEFLYNLATEQQSQIDAIYSGAGQTQQKAPLIDLNSPLQVSPSLPTAPVLPSNAVDMGEPSVPNVSGNTASAVPFSASNAPTPTVPTLAFKNEGADEVGDEVDDDNDVSEQTFTPNGWGGNHTVGQ